MLKWNNDICYGVKKMQNNIFCVLPTGRGKVEYGAVSNFLTFLLPEI